MKRSNGLLIAVILLAYVSCKKQPGPVNEKNYAPHYIALNKYQPVNMDGEILTCSLDSVIQDSRCPVNATCVWQGVAVARFKISRKNIQNTITLATFKFGEYDTNTTVAGFKIELINVSPYPELAIPHNYNDYVAEVKITKL
ncbi:MAG: hypothetical protein ABI707_03475 [Ferruginibacter sp.]